MNVAARVMTAVSSLAVLAAVCFVVCWKRQEPIVRDSSFGIEDSRAASIEERCQELGVSPQHTPYVSMAFTHFSSLTNVTPFEKRLAHYRFKVRILTNDTVSVLFIPRRDSDDLYACGGSTKFGKGIEYRFDRSSTQMLSHMVWK